MFRFKRLTPSCLCRKSCSSWGQGVLEVGVKGAFFVPHSVHRVSSCHWHCVVPTSMQCGSVRFWIKFNPGPSKLLGSIFIQNVAVWDCFPWLDSCWAVSPRHAPTLCPAAVMWDRVGTWCCIFSFLHAEWLFACLLVFSNQKLEAGYLFCFHEKVFRYSLGID